MANSPQLPASLFQKLPFNPDPHAIWMGSTFTLRRNLGRYNFPSKLSAQDSTQVLETLKITLTSMGEIENPQFFLLKDWSAKDRELLFEHFLFLQGLQEPPNSSAFVLNQNTDFLALINTTNHLHLHALCSTPQWEATWNLLSKIETQISGQNGLAYLPKFGYLTADPARSGTGLSVQVFLHLPALIHAHQLQGALANGQDPDVTFMGLSGSLDGVIADLIILQNTYSLGVSEESILHSLQIAATKLIGAEKTMRQHLKEEQSSEIKDLISKSFGLLVHAYQLETKEALDLLSLMKFGLDLGYVTTVTSGKLDELFFKCRRGYFSHLFPDLTDPKAIAQKRADFLKDELKGINLSPELK